MSARDELRAMQDGKPPPVDHAAALTAALGQDERGRRVVTANVYGRGPNASVDIILDDGERLHIERFSDLAKPQVLSATVVTLTGVFRTFKPPEAGAIAAAVHKLATHHDQADEDAVVGEWGSEYLRFTPTIDVDMSDQKGRWDAFSALARMNPAQDSGEDRSAPSYAACGTLLVDEQTEMRYLRAGWFVQYVKREAGGLYSPARLAQAMLRVGWTRPGAQGRVKATCPDTGQQLTWPFYTVAADWEHAVIASVSPRVRATHTREVVPPAITADPAPSDEPRRHVDGTAYDEPPAWMPQRDGVPS